MFDAAEPTTGKTAAEADAGAAPAGSPLEEVPLVLLKLGVSCCGGPIAFAIVFTTSLTV